jgi:hypothetical protein
MINLIPPEAQRRITYEYGARVVTVCLLLWALAGVVVGVATLPSYLLVTERLQAVSVDLAAATASADSDSAVSRALIVASEQARLLREAENTQRFSTLVAVVEAAAGSGVSISSYDFGRDGQALRPVVVGGNAASRQALAAFRDALLAQPLVEEVNLPISNFARDRDIDFSLSISVSSSTDSL